MLFFKVVVVLWRETESAAMMQHLAVTDMVTDPWFHVSLVNINAVKINFSKDQVKTADLNVNPHASKTSEPNIPRSVFLLLLLFVRATSLSCQVVHETFTDPQQTRDNGEIFFKTIFIVFLNRRCA